MVVEQRLLCNEEQSRGDDPGTEREQLEPPQQHDRGHQPDRHQHTRRRSPVEWVEQHALDVVRDRGAKAARVAVIGDNRLPELVQRARVGDEEHRPDGECAGECRTGRPPRPAGNEEHGQRRDYRKCEQLDGDGGSGEHARGRPAPRAAACVERDRDRAEREGDRRRVRLDTRGLHGPGRRDREQCGRAECSPDTGELPADRVGGHQPERARRARRRPGSPRRRRPAGATVPAAARRSRAAATRTRPSPAPVRGGERRARRGRRPRRSSRPPPRLGRRRMPRPRAAGQPQRLAEPTPRGQGTVTVTGFESRKTSPNSGSSIQFAAAPTLYVHVPGPGRSTALVLRNVFSSTETSVQRSAPPPSVKQR